MNGDIWKRHGLPPIITAILTAGSLIGYLQINPPRDDPYKGQDATELRRELETKITASRRQEMNRLTAMEDHIVHRLEALESRNEQILNVQSEIWKSLSNLPPDRWRRRIESLEDRHLKTDPEYNKPD